ncbi:MAG: hypothetical protein JRJ39_14050 [Deltaproteobacteria bacterium]|nr:hypothetical protein [Deltaproteobacteria bacterium]
MTNKSFYKVALLAAILSAVSWIAFILGGMSKPALSEISDPRQFFQTIQDTRTVWLMYGWGGIFGTLLSVPYVIAFYYAMKDTGPGILLSIVIALIGATLTLFGFFSPLTTLYYYLPVGLVATPESLPVFKAAAEVAVQVFEAPWFVGSFLIFGLGFGLIAYFGLRTSTGPNWLNVVGILAGLAGIIWLENFLPFLEPIGVILRLLNILLIFVWSIGLSAALVRQKEPITQ